LDECFEFDVLVEIMFLRPLKDMGVEILVFPQLVRVLRHFHIRPNLIFDRGITYLLIICGCVKMPIQLELFFILDIRVCLVIIGVVVPQTSHYLVVSEGSDVADGRNVF
jgi:hypothetical protein